MDLEQPTPADRFIGAIAEKLGATARVAAIFAEPVVQEGVTVIPVAKARWGFGGGAGRSKDQDGGGGGGAAQISPVGFIEIKNGEAHFQPIRTVSIPLMIAGAVSILLLLQKTIRR